MANIALDTSTQAPAAAQRGEVRRAAKARARLPSWATMKTILAFWAFYFFINTIRMAAVEAEGQAGMLVRRTVVSLIGIALTTLLWQVLRRFEAKSMRAMVIAAFATYAVLKYGPMIAQATMKKYQFSAESMIWNSSAGFPFFFSSCISRSSESWGCTT